MAFDNTLETFTFKNTSYVNNVSSCKCFNSYSVPAWGEPVAELGEIPPTEWFRHNPYAEWYHNTIRLEGSPA